MTTFTCKDCEIEFGTAKAFVDHVPTCVPYNADASLFLQNAAILLRGLVKSAHALINQYPDHNYAKRLKRDADLAYAWLKTNKLQGDLK